MRVSDVLRGTLKRTANSRGEDERRPSVPLAFILLACSLTVILVGGTILDVSFLIALLAGATVAAVIGVAAGLQWQDIEQGILDTMYRGLIAVVILLLVGILIGIWIASGTVPFILYWGLQILSPETFLVGVFVICAIFALGNGSSFATIGSAGLALLGVGQAMGYPAGLTVGAILGGVYVGDKASPVSDTTNTAAAITGIGLFRHIYSLLYVTIPAAVVSLVIYGVIGATHTAGSTPGQVGTLTSVIEENFSLSPLALLPPLVLVGLAVLRMPALPTITISIFAGAVVAAGVEGHSFDKIMQVATGGYEPQTGNKIVDNLLAVGGIEGMLSTVGLLLCALIYGGVLEGTKTIYVVIDTFIRKVRSTGSLIVSLLMSCWVMLVGTGNTYVTIIVPGRAYLGTFRKWRIHPSVLSRTLEDGGTIASPFIPWGLTAVFIVSVLQVPTSAYAPYAFFLYLVPLFSIIYGVTGFAIFRDDSTTEAPEPAATGTTSS